MGTTSYELGYFDAVIACALQAFGATDYSDLTFGQQEVWHASLWAYNTRLAMESDVEEGA